MARASQCQICQTRSSQALHPISFHRCFSFSLCGQHHVMLFMSTLTIEVSAIIGINPLPLIFAEICAANIGGASTMVGDPPNVILGTIFSFPYGLRKEHRGDCLDRVPRHTVFFVWFYKKEIFQARDRLLQDPAWVQKEIDKINPKEAIQDRRLFWVGLGSIFYVVIVLVTHHLTHMSVAICALSGALIALLTGDIRWVKYWRRSIIRRLPSCRAFSYRRSNGARRPAENSRLRCERGLRGSLFIALSIILWISAFGSSIVDNVPLQPPWPPSSNI